jgi:hypothetical protein
MGGKERGRGERKGEKRDGEGVVEGRGRDRVRD